MDLFTKQITLYICAMLRVNFCSDSQSKGKSVLFISYNSASYSYSSFIIVLPVPIKEVESILHSAMLFKDL